MFLLCTIKTKCLQPWEQVIHCLKEQSEFITTYLLLTHKFILKKLKTDDRKIKCVHSATMNTAKE